MKTWKWFGVAMLCLPLTVYGQVREAGGPPPAASGTVTVSGIKPEYELGEAIVPVLDMSGVPAGAQIQPGFRFSVTTDAKRHEIKEPLPGTYHIWGSPGKYSVMAIGMWGLPVPNEPGKWQSFGMIFEQLSFAVKGSDGPSPPPVPPPPDPPQPGGKKQVMLWYSEGLLDNLTQAQRDVLTSLVFRDWLKSEGHVLQEVLDPTRLSAGSVPEKYRAWVTSVSGKELPAISLAPKDGGAIVTFLLPKDIAAVKALVSGKAVW